MGNNHSKTSDVCPVVNESGPDIVPLVGTLTFHKLAVIISGALAIVSCLVALLLTLSHATHFSNPPEQKQILRILTILPTFAIISFLCVWQDGTPATYIVGALDISEALPMAAFFLLMSAYVAPEEGNREAFFEQLEMIDKKGNSQGVGSLKWYQKLSFMVLQWVPVSILTWVATVIALAAGTYCATSNKPHFAHIWISLIRMFSTALAIMAILRFYKRSKAVLQPRRTMKQLICFKILVALNFLQTFVFNFLVSGGHLHASKHLTFHDLATAIPSLLLSCEVALLAPFYFYAYSVSPYKLAHSTAAAGQYYHGACGAIFSAINVLDIVLAMVRAVRGRVSGGGSAGGNMEAQMGRERRGGGRRGNGRRGDMRMDYVSAEGADRFGEDADEFGSHRMALLNGRGQQHQGQVYSQLG